LSSKKHCGWIHSIDSSVMWHIPVSWVAHTSTVDRFLLISIRGSASINESSRPDQTWFGSLKWRADKTHPSNKDVCQWLFLSVFCISAASICYLTAVSASEKTASLWQSVWFSLIGSSLAGLHFHFSHTAQTDTVQADCRHPVWEVFLLKLHTKTVSKLAWFKQIILQTLLSSCSFILSHFGCFL